MMMQELPMDQMNLAGGGEHQTHLDRLENLKEEVGVDVKPGWEAGGVTDIKPPWDRKLLSPHSPPPHHRQWIRPEDYEDEQRAKSALENGVHGRGDFIEGMGNEEDHFGPFSGGPQGSPFHEGPPTPHGVHSFSPETMIHNGLEGGPQANNSVSKKSSSRRNAWGNLSYADLITQAILSSPEKRLTLSQVYDWMVQNIPYFKDKGDSNSSAGWKNSIRHNLSLHSKFMRVQNEGTGKSSWWMVNPDASKSGKSSRRRASNPDNGKGFDNRRRGRSKKSLDAFGNGQESTPSPNGIVEGFPDSPLPPGYPGFPHDMRLRAGSNGSEFVAGGRMSPLRHEFFQEGGWPPHGPPGQEYHGNMIAYGGPPPHGFRPDFCPDQNGEMMERIGLDPRMSPHPGMPPHLRPNGFPGYPRPPFHHDPAYPHSPLLSHPGPGEHYQTNSLGSHVSPAHVPSLSPIPQSAPGYPSPEHAGAPPTPVSAHEPLMSPHHLQNRQFFPGGGAAPSQQAPDSPAPPSSSSSGSMLERALTKQEPGEVSPLETGEHPVQPHHHPAHPAHPGHHHHQSDWPHVAPGFGDVNVEEYIKHDFGMDQNIEFPGYPGHHHHGQTAEDQHHQYAHQAHQAHQPAPVSVAPPWVR